MPGARLPMRKLRELLRLHAAGLPGRQTAMLGELRRSGGSNVKDVKLREIVLAAPDLSRTVFEQLAGKFAGLARGGITLYASSADKAMWRSKKAKIDVDRAGDVPVGGPVVVRGVETIDVTSASTSLFSSNHTDFADREQLVEDMRTLFDKSLHPPSARGTVFKPVSAWGKEYWKYEE